MKGIDRNVRKAKEVGREVMVESAGGAGATGKRGTGPISAYDTLSKPLLPTISGQNLNILMKAVKASKLKGGYLFANIGEVRDRNIIAYAADFFLTIEGVLTTFVHGTIGADVFVSAKTESLMLNLGNKMREAFPGMADGNAQMASATITLSILKPADNLEQKMDRVLKTRFLEAVGFLRPRKQRKSERH
jgi:nanoRNase/pAp phosphatase (c-di-AMP/oligoRNAs hydrolase)